LDEKGPKIGPQKVASGTAR